MIGHPPRNAAALDDERDNDRAGWHRLAVSVGCSSAEAWEWTRIATHKLCYPDDREVFLEEVMAHRARKAQIRTQIRLALANHRPAPAAGP
jgi:hypothetical protein